MRKLVVAAFVSLDGVMQAPGGPEEDRSGEFAHGGWLPPHWNDELGEVLDAAFSRPFDLLLGRETYEIFAAHWPAISGDPVADGLNAARKYVATSKPGALTWQNSHALEGDVATAVARLKQEEGPELRTQGGSVLIQALLAADLVDSFQLLVFPVLLGSGKRLFGPGTVPAGLRLVESRSLANGVLILSYERTGTPETGSFALESPTEAEIARRKARDQAG